MTAWVYLIFFLYGVAFGSFLNVCIHRIPQQQSLLAGSKCPHCKAPVRYYDNIPIVSFLLLRGRCRNCQAPIALRYLLVELSTGILFMAGLWRFGLGWSLLFNTLLLCIILVLMLIDYDYKILPNVITLPGAAIGLLASPFQEQEFYLDSLTQWASSGVRSAQNQDLAVAYVGSLIGLIIGGGLLWLVAELYYRFRKVEGLGFGDVKMMAMVGAFLGWKYALLTVFVGSISGSVVGLAIMKLQNRDASYQMPFGTFLGLGTAISVFFGQELLEWYLQFY